MALTNEKKEALLKILSADEERAKELLALPVEEACEKINAEGYAFEAQDLTDFVEAVVDAKEGELGEDELEAVAGGVDPISLAFKLIIWQGEHAWNAGQRIGRKIAAKIKKRKH